MNGLTYIVTGAAGHLGGYVVSYLLKDDRKVRAFVLPKESCGVNDPNFSEYKGDVTDMSSLERLFDGVNGEDCVFIHCAGIISIYGKDDPFVTKVNVTGTQNVVRLCEEHKVKRLVYVSSVHALPELPKGCSIEEVAHFKPDELRGCYAKTKAEATQIVLDAVEVGLDAVVVHPAGIIGPNTSKGGNINHLVHMFLGGKLPAAVRGGFDFVDVRDVANGVIAAADKGRMGECYILSNRFINLREFFDVLAEVSGVRKLKVYLPIWFAKIATPFTELYYRVAKKIPLFTAYSLDTLKQNAVFSHKKADRELGYKTRSLYETLRDTVAKIDVGEMKRNAVRSIRRGARRKRQTT